MVTDAYDYTDKLLKTLVNERIVNAVSKEFNEIKDNAERVKHLEKILIQYKLIPKLANFHVPKNSQISTNYRKEGNKFYKNRQFIEALECYNKSLCFAEKNDQNIGLSYANRSAIYCEMKFYNRALKNIDMAEQNNYPEQMMDKLIARRQICIDSNDIENDSIKPLGEKFLKLSHEANKKLPFIANCLELKSDNKFGRYIVTNKDLKSGDIIGIEKPFSKCLLPACIYKYCANCLNDCVLDLYPCEQCTAAMFCSDECRNEGMKKFHSYECKIIGVLNGIYTKILRIANHTFFQALCIFDYDIQQLISSMEENEDSSVTVYDFDLNEKGDERKKMFMAIDSLVTNEKYRTSSDLFQRAGIVAILTHLMLNFTDLKFTLPNEKEKDFYRRFIMKQTQIAALNYHGVFDGVLKKSQINGTDQYGSASFPFSSLINHSCAPNLVRVSYNCKNYIMVNRPIKAGQQLFDNYGFHHCLESLKDRQKSLKSQYMFECACEACRNEYPLYTELKNKIRTPAIIEDDIKKLQKLDLDTAEYRYRYCGALLDELDERGNYPCTEISTLQECLLRCFFIFKMAKFNLQLIKLDKTTMIDI